MGHPNDPQQVDGDNSVPLGTRRAKERSHFTPTGIIDKYIAAPLSLDDISVARGQLSDVTDTHAHRTCPKTCGRDHRDGLTRARLVHVSDNDIRPTAGEVDGDRSPDACCATSYDRYRAD
jgi:hypothetical protein